MTNANNIKEDLKKLAEFSEQEGQITRQTFSRAWEEALIWLKAKMEACDMQTQIDGMGNLIGTYEPLPTGAPPVGIGSHLDTVINGGAYDGALGIVCGLELIRSLRRDGIKLAFPIKLIAFAEEEGGVFGKGCLGSSYMTGKLSSESFAALYQKNGSSLAETIGKLSFELPRLGSDYGWAQNHFHAFFEIHAEQGPDMYENGIEIGLVDGVVGILRAEVTFMGQSNHAGTTVMSKRKDAAVALSDFVLRTYGYGIENDRKLVVTNGKISVFPNQHNVVPGMATTTMEIRAAEDCTIHKAYSYLSQIAHEVAEKYNMQMNITQTSYVKPVKFDDKLLSLATGVRQQNEKVISTFSWAGHDAKLMSSVCPGMMIFVPSKDGLSHCPEEYSSPKAAAQATDFLIRILRRM